MVLAALGSRAHGGKRWALQTIFDLTHRIHDVTVRSPLVLEAPKGAVLGLGEGGVFLAPGLLAHEVQDAHISFGVAVVQTVLVVPGIVDETRLLGTSIDRACFPGSEDVSLNLVERAPLGLGVFVGAVAGGNGTSREYASPHGYISRPVEPVLPTVGSRGSVHSKSCATDTPLDRTKLVSNIDVSRQSVSTAPPGLGTDNGETRGLGTRIMLTHGFPSLSSTRRTG